MLPRAGYVRPKPSVVQRRQRVRLGQDAVLANTLLVRAVHRMERVLPVLQEVLNRIQTPPRRVAMHVQLGNILLPVRQRVRLGRLVLVRPVSSLLLEVQPLIRRVLPVLQEVLNQIQTAPRRVVPV